MSPKSISIDYRLTVFIVAAAFSLIFGCATSPPVGRERVVKTSASERPKWIFRIPSDSTKDMFFRGIKTSVTTEGAAVDDARANAVKQVIEMINSKGMVDYTSVRVEKGSKEDPVVSRIVKDGIKILAKNVTKGVREVEAYWEKIERVTELGLQYFYNGYVLVRFPKEEYKNALQNTVQEQKEEAQKEADAEALEFLKKLEEEFENF